MQPGAGDGPAPAVAAAPRPPPTRAPPPVRAAPPRPSVPEQLQRRRQSRTPGVEAVTEGSGRSAMDEVVIRRETNKKILLQLFKDMSNKLDYGRDEEKSEKDKGKSAIEEDSNMTMVDPSSTSSMTIQDDHDSERNFEAEGFVSHRRSWESNWSKTCGSFDDITVLTSMQFTHHTPGLIPLGSAGYMLGTLQILSIKLTGIVGGLQLPLSVYGVVAARDIVDRNRNILFYCSRSEAQELKQNDPFLHLSGPSRAIVNTDDMVYIEIELKVKGAVESQDKPLMTCVLGHSGLSTMCFKNDLCMLELCSQRVGQTVQATILGVRVVKGKGSCPLNFKYGGLVACTPLSGKLEFSDGGVTRMKNPSSNKIVLLDSKDGPMPEGVDGYLHLWRQVISVEFEGGLDVVIQAYSESGGIAAESCVHFVPKNNNISRKKFPLGDAQVTITVAWSLVPMDNLATGKLAKKNRTNTCMEGVSRKLMVMGQQSNVSPRSKKNPMQQLLKGNKFAILSTLSDDETDEKDRGKSAIEGAYMSGDKKNPNDRGEEAVTEGSSKSAMDEEVISPETNRKILLQLFKDMSKKVDHGGDDEKGEMDNGKSAIEEDSSMTMIDPSSTNSMTIRDVHYSEMDFEAERFALYRRSWESNWSKTCGSFQDITVLTSMQFTHYTPGLIPLGSAGYMTGTLQVLSIKLTDIAGGGLQLPLSVYGVVAARDSVDRNRNILFNCGRSEAQELKQNDPFLHLSGPSRAIVNTDDTVYIEIELKLKGDVESQDKPLMTCVHGHSGLSTMCFKNDLCMLELCSQRVGRTVQATILGVRVVKGKGSCPLNFKYGGLVACTPLSGEFVFSDGGFTRKHNPSSNKIVLLESKDGPMPEGVIGYLDLWRQVVSVEFEGGLDVVVQAYSESGDIAAESCVHFMPKKSNISQKIFALGDAQVTITVAWSLVPTDKDEVVSEVCRRRWAV